MPFSVSLRPGIPIHEQVVYAVRRAVVTGELRAGDSFPSVRVLSQALKINPNTAHRIVGTLTGEGLLAVHAGIGTVVSEPRAAGVAVRRAVLGADAERLVVEARCAGLTLHALLAAIRRHWSNTAVGDK